MIDPALTPALFGLLGVLAGGSIQALVAQRGRTIENIREIRRAVTEAADSIVTVEALMRSCVHAHLNYTSDPGLDQERVDEFMAPMLNEAELALAKQASALTPLLAVPDHRVSEAAFATREEVQSATHRFATTPRKDWDHRAMLSEDCDALLWSVSVLMSQVSPRRWEHVHRFRSRDEALMEIRKSGLRKSIDRKSVESRVSRRMPESKTGNDE